MLVLLIQEIYEVRRWDGMVYIPGLIKIGTGVQVILRFFFRYLGGCNVGITDVIDL
jgi:hypothetical protein